MSGFFSLIIPTLNEAAHLPATLSAAQRAFGDQAEYIVCDGGSSDATCEIAARAGAHVLIGEKGRGEQLHRGYRRAQGEVCVFLHADTLLPSDAADALRRALADPAVAGGAFSLCFAGPARDRLLLRGLQRAINWRSRLFRFATGDQVIFARRTALDRLGGVPRVPLFEDVRLCRGLKRTGRFVILRQHVETSPRLWSALGPTRGILLHVLFRTLHALGASPRLLARCYPSPR